MATKPREPISHELEVQYLKGMKVWVGRCSCGRFEIEVDSPRQGKKAPATIESNFDIHRLRHRSP